MRKIETALSHDDLRAIGRITANFALLELMISNCIGSLLGTDGPTGQIVTAELSFSHLATLFSSLYRNRTSDPQAINELKNLLSLVAKAEEQRNKVTHSIWGADPAGGKLARLKTTAKRSSGLKYQVQEMTTEDLNEIADFISKVATDVTEFMGRLERTT